MKRLLLLSLACTGLILGGISFGQAVVPQEQGGKYYFQIANVYFEIDPDFGARISSLKIGDQEILFQSSYVGDFLWGSTLWQSPQSAWGWPPSVALDQDPYAGGITENKVILRSDIDETYSHLRFNKTFSADLSDTAVTIVYTMINEGTTAQSFSAWEVTRVPSGGMSFFPKGDGTITGAFATQTEVIDDVVWYEHESSDPEGQKFFSDGAEGWSAHVNGDTNLFIKNFEDVALADCAPGENEIELWYNSLTSYIELENQNAYTNINVGDSISWTMKWYARKLPASVQPLKGDAGLVDYVRGILGNEPPPPPETIANTINSGLKIYPNPASEYLFITNLPAGISNLMISDVFGKVVLRKQIIKGEQIQLKDLQSGVYFYQVHGVSISGSGKLIIKK